MRDASYVVLDIETTGLRPGRHGITELYAARTDGYGKKIDEFHSFVDPGHPIPSFITKLTGITDDMVDGAPSAAEMIRSFDSFVSPDDVLVGHNLRFDLSFLNHARQRAIGRQFLNDPLCTLLLSRRVFASKPLPSYRLGELAKYFEIDAEGAHRAKKDVEMTVAVKQELFKRLEQTEMQQLRSLLHFQRMPLAKAASLLE